MKTKISPLRLDCLSGSNIELFLKREDLTHPFVSGNKYRKLKYNLAHAKAHQYQGLLTFGGAYSNHILATAFAAYQNDMPSIGIIRGDELAKLNPENYNFTLKKAQEYGMKFIFVSRSEYRNKNSKEYQDKWSKEYPNYLILPEGGSNILAVKGCEEILDENTKDFTHICVAMGTGATFSGIVNSSLEHQKVIGFPALKNANFLEQDVLSWVNKNNYTLEHAYSFGGYGKVNQELVDFINKFTAETQIPIDPIYVSKMIFGTLDLIKNRNFADHSKILMIHSGGIQGIKGYNEKVKNNKMYIDESFNNNYFNNVDEHCSLGTEKK